MANRSRDLTLESLQRLAMGLVQSPSFTSLVSGSTAVSSRALTTGRTEANVHNVCINAVFYRQGREEFDRLATAVPNTNENEWRCNRCNMPLLEVNLRLSVGSQDRIWIGPVGFFKGHCDRRPEQPHGWTCIWPVAAPACNSRFDTERALLEHMRDFHVSLGVGGQDSTIERAADWHSLEARTCGFGALIGGQRMQNANGSFVVPGSLQ